MPPSSYYTGSSLLQCVRCARQQVEVQQGFATDLYDLERLYPATEEGAEQLIEEVIATIRSPLSPCLSPSSSGSDVHSTHKDKEALVNLLGAEKIPLEIGLVFLPSKIQCLYQEHQVARREALSHSPAHEVGFTLGMNGRERGNRYRTPTPYPKHCTRQKKVYIADTHKQRYEQAYNPDLDHYYDLYLCPHSYLQSLCTYPY